MVTTPAASYDGAVIIDAEIARARSLAWAGEEIAAGQLLLSLTARDALEQLEILGLIGEIYVSVGADDTVAQCIQQMEDLLGQLGPAADPQGRHGRRVRFLRVGHAAAAGEHERAAAELATLAADGTDAELVTHARILCAAALGDDDLHVRALPLWERVLEEITRPGATGEAADHLLVAGGLGYGRFCVETGRLPEAEPWLRRAGARAEARGWEAATARTALERAAASWTAGDYDATERLAVEALPVLTRHGRADDVARCELFIGFIRMAVGELAAADEAWAHAEQLWRTLGKPLRLHRILLQRSWIPVFWGRFADAVELVAQARDQLDASPRSSWLQYARLDDHLGTVWRADALADLGLDSAADPDDTIEEVEAKHAASLGVVWDTPSAERERSAMAKLDQAAELKIPAALAVDSVRYAIADADARMRWATAVSAPMLAGAFAVAQEWENTALLSELVEYHSARGAFVPAAEPGGGPAMPDLATTAVAIDAIDTPDDVDGFALVAGGETAAGGSSLTRLAPLPPLVMDPGAAPVLDRYRALAAQRYGRDVIADEPAWSTWP